MSVRGAAGRWFAAPARNCEQRLRLKESRPVGRIALGDDVHRIGL